MINIVILLIHSFFFNKWKLSMALVAHKMP